jgi:N-acyl-D-amino-acid deacylase
MGWRAVLIALVGALALAFALGDAHAADADGLDVLIVNGEVVDGTGAPGIEKAIGVRGGKIAFVGDAAGVTATRVVDAAGLIVAPGFIDPHTHALEDLLSDDEAERNNDRWLAQGVTTVFVGNDGRGTPDVADLRKRVSDKRIGTNVAFFVGHGAVRLAVMGNANREPTLDELGRMKALVSAGMKEGALGLSTGLFYTPGSYSKTSEVIALARIAAQHGGVYESHLRDEGSYGVGLVASVEEAITIGREARLPIHIAHIKALGADVWGKSEAVVHLIETAQRSGLAITADQYPFLASGTTLRSSLLPREILEGDEAAIRARLSDPRDAGKLDEIVAANLQRRGGADTLMFTGLDRVSGDQRWSKWQGATLADAAMQEDKTPLKLALRLMREGNPRVISFNMDAADLERFMVQDWVMTGSDGGEGHPRGAATFALKYASYVRDKKLMTLPAFVHRSAGLTAETFNLPDRGFLKQGYVADIVVFDPAQYAPRANFQNPYALAVGVVYLLVNGQLVLDRGKMKSLLAGKALTSGAIKSYAEPVLNPRRQ